MGVGGWGGCVWGGEVLVLTSGNKYISVARYCDTFPGYVRCCVDSGNGGCGSDGDIVGGIDCGNEDDSDSDGESVGGVKRSNGGDNGSDGECWWY